jgi:hypothetical protein
MAEPLSPELILVSPPEDAALAREQLDDPPVSLSSDRASAKPFQSAASEPAAADPSETSQDEFPADNVTDYVRARNSVDFAAKVIAAVAAFAVGAILLYRLVLWIRWLFLAP